MVSVLRDELPVPDAAVVFHDAYGRVLGTTRTDSTGHASGEISTWGMVTVVDPRFPQRLTTITHVALGAALEVPLTPVYTPAPQVGTLAIAAPATSPPAETFQYSIQTPCASDGALTLPATIPLYEGCAPEFPVLITARTQNQNLEDPGRALAYVAGQAIDGTFQPGAWSTQCKQIAVATELSMSLQLWPRLDNYVFRYVDLGFCPASPSMLPSLDFAEGGVAYAFGYVQGAPLRTASLLRDLATVPASLELPRTELLIGDVELTRFDGKGAVWTSDPALADADAVDAKLTWSPSAGTYVEWRFVLPRDATSAPVPELPAELRTWTTLDGATEVILDLRYLDASWLASLQDVEAELPLMLDGARSKRGPAAGGSLRDYTEQIHPLQQ